MKQVVTNFEPFSFVFLTMIREMCDSSVWKVFQMEILYSVSLNRILSTVDAIDSIQTDRIKNFSLKYLLDERLSQKDCPVLFFIKSYTLKNISVSAPESIIANFGEPNSNLR